MATKIDQKTYLQKYLSGPSGDKKKKKKKVVKGSGIKIIDDDIDLAKLRPLEGDELDIFDAGEDAPQIAGIIDERPEDVQKMEQFKTTTKWKVVNQDDGFSSKLQIEEIKRDVKETEKDNEIIFGKMYSDSEDENKNDSDLSPPRKQNSENRRNPSKSHGSDSDFSPPRRKEKDSPKKTQSRNHYDSDPSPPRKHDNKQKDRVRKPSRWGEPERSIEKTRQGSSDDESSKWSKKQKEKKSRRSPSSDQLPPRKSKKKNYGSDLSPPRKSRRDSPKRRDSDASPPRRRKSKDKERNNYDKPSSSREERRRKHSTDSDQSLPRKQRQSFEKRKNENHSKKEQSRKDSSDSDLSPPRKNRRQKSISPSRKPKRHSPDRSKKRRHDNDSDLSPPRRERNRRNSESPPPSNKKMAKTLEGKIAGLQDAKQLRHENAEFRRREDEVYSKMTDEVSGKNAQIVSRKGKRETSEERRQQKEKAEKQKELDEKYKKWSKGLKQIEAEQEKIQDFMHEASKPLARHKGDHDLEDRLKRIERDGDPMLAYMREKKRERGELGPEKPSYKGSFPPNRFNIRPGYRWDGVDRSNGYEKKFFEQQSKRKAQEEEAYKWSTEDL